VWVNDVNANGFLADTPITVHAGSLTYTSLERPNFCSLPTHHLLIQIMLFTLSENATFVDRSGTEITFAAALLPEALRQYRSGTESPSQIIFKAELVTAIGGEEGGDGPVTISAVSPALLIDQRAMIRPLMGLSFIGSVINSQPPDGVLPSYWFRYVLCPQTSSFSSPHLSKRRTRFSTPHQVGLVHYV